MQFLPLFTRDCGHTTEAEDEAEIELSFQELLQSSPYICIAVGALSACLTFAVLVSMYIPADRSGNPSVCAGKRKMVTERACQTGCYDRSCLTTDHRLRKLRSTSYGPLQEHSEAEVYTGDGIKEYSSSEFAPVKYKSKRVSEIGSANIIHNNCDCFPESASRHKLASLMSSKHSHPQLSMQSAKGVLNQRHKHLVGKRPPQGSLAHARDVKYPVQIVHGKLSHITGNPPKQYKYLKHNDQNLTMTNPTLCKSQRKRTASRPPSNRLSVIPSSKHVASSESNTARCLCCYGNHDPSNQLDNNGEDGSKIHYSSDYISGDKTKRKYPHPKRSKITSCPCQNKLLKKSGVTHPAENYALFFARGAYRASWDNYAKFYGQTLAPGQINKPSASTSSSNNVSSTIFNSEGSSNDQSRSRSLEDISSDEDSFTSSYAKQQSHSDLHGLTESNRLQKDRLLPSQKFVKSGMLLSMSPQARKPPCGHSKEHKTHISKRQRKRNYVNKHLCRMPTHDMWKTDASIGCSEQFGNSANALLCRSPGEADENTWSSVAEPRRRTHEATLKQRITYRQCSAAREFHQKVPTFTLHAARPEDSHSNINPNQESGQCHREGCINANQSLYTQTSNTTLVILDNCSNELRSLMKATILDLQKYKRSRLTGTCESPSSVEELSTGSRAGTEHIFSRTQSRSKHFGNQKRADNSNSYARDISVCRDQNCVIKFRRRHQILQNSSEPSFSDDTSLARRTGTDQLFSRPQCCSRHVGSRVDQGNSKCRPQDTSIRDCSCNSKFSRNNQMSEDKRIQVSEDKSIQIHNTLTGAEATETSVIMSSLKQKQQKRTHLVDTSKEKSEDSRKQIHGTVTKAERTVKNRAVLSRRHEKQLMGHKENTHRKEFLSEQCFGKGSETIVTMKCQDNQYNCSGNFFTNINCEGLESGLCYNHDMIGSESKFEKGSQRKQSLACPKINIIGQEGSGKRKRTELPKLQPTGCRRRAEKCSKMHNCESHTVANYFNKEAAVFPPNKYTLNKGLARCKNTSQHEIISGTPPIAHSSELINDHSDRAGMPEKCQHRFNYVGDSKQIEVGHRGRELKDGSETFQAHAHRGQHSSRSDVYEYTSKGDDVSSSECIPHSSDVSLMTNNSAEVTDVSKQTTFIYSHKSTSIEIQDSETTYILKDRKTHKYKTAEVNSAVDSRSLTYSPDSVLNFTSSQIPDTSNETNSKKQDKLSKDNSTLCCEETAVDTCSVSCDERLNTNEYSIAASATSSQAQIHPCQHSNSMLEIHDRNVSHKSQAIYAAPDIPHPSWQSKRQQDDYHRREKLHKTTTKTNDKRNYKHKQDGTDHCDVRGRETFPAINKNQRKQMARWNHHSSDTFQPTKQHLRPKEKLNLTSKKCTLNIAGNKKCSQMVFLRSLPQTSSECSLVSNSHILTVTGGQIYGTQMSSSSHSRSSSTSMYVAQLITNSSSVDPSGNTYSLQDAVVIKTDSLCRYGYQLSASTSIATECSRTCTDTSCYPIQYTYGGNSLISRVKTSVDQSGDTSVSTLQDMLNIDSLPYNPPARNEYYMGATSWSGTRTTRSNEISLSSSDGSDLSIYYECASTQSLLVEQIKNICPIVQSTKGAGLGCRDLQPELGKYNMGMYLASQQEHSYGTAPLSDSCNDECCCYGTAHIPDSCNIEHSYRTVPLPNPSKLKRSCGKIQSPTSSHLMRSSGSVIPQDSSNFEHSVGTVQASDSSNPKNSSVIVRTSDSSSPELRFRTVEALGSSSSVDNSGILQEPDSCNPEGSSMLVHAPDRFGHKPRAGIMEPLASSSHKHSYGTMQALAFSSHKHRAVASSCHKHISKKPQALKSSNPKPHHWSSHAPDNYLSHRWKPSSKTRQRPSTRRRKPVSSPLSPPSIPLNEERVSYMQITSKNGAFKGLRLSELDQHSFPSILKKSLSKSNPIKYVSGDNNLTLERQPFSPLVSQQPFSGSRSNVSLASDSCTPTSEKCVRTKSRLAGGDIHCKQDILVQQISPGEVGGLELRPKIHGDRQVIKNSHKKSSPTKQTVSHLEPHNDVIKKSTHQTDFAKTSKCKKKIIENKIPSYDSASFQPVYKVSTPGKIIKRKIKTKQAPIPRNKQKSKLPILYSKKTKTENRYPSKNDNFEKTRKKVFKTSENHQKVSFISKNCQNMSTKKKRMGFTTNKSFEPVEIKRTKVNNERYNLDNPFTKDFIPTPYNLCGPCLPTNHKCRNECNQTVQQVNVCPKTTCIQSPTAVQNPRRQKYLQKKIYKTNAYSGESYTAESTQISTHQTPTSHKCELYNTESECVAKSHKSEECNCESCTSEINQINVYRRPKICYGKSVVVDNIRNLKVCKPEKHKCELFVTENTPVGKKLKSEEFNNESWTGGNSQINVYRRPKPYNGEPRIAENIRDSKVYKQHSYKYELYNSGCKQMHKHRKTEEYNNESSTSEDSQPKIHCRRKTYIGKPYIAGSKQNSTACKPERYTREVLKAKYKQFGTNREAGEKNGLLNTIENTEISLHHKPAVHRWELNTEKEQVSKTFKPGVYNGESFTGKNSQIRKYQKAETCNEESHNTKITKVSKTQDRCPNKYTSDKMKMSNTNNETLCKLGSPSTGQCIVESKDRESCIATLSPEVFKERAVSAVKTAKTKMAESRRYLNNLDHKKKSEYKELTKDQLEDTTSTFSRKLPWRVSRQSTLCKPEADIEHKRSEHLVQSAYKIPQSYTGPHAEVDDDSRVGVAVSSSPQFEINRTDRLEQQVKNTQLQPVWKPEQSDRQRMSNRHKWQRPVNRKVIRKTLKDNVYPLNNILSTCPPSGLQKTAQSLDICNPEGQSAVNEVIPTERSSNVSYGLLCSKLPNNTSKTTKDMCFKQKSSQNSAKKFSHSGDLEERPRQGGASSPGETITRNLSGSPTASQAGMNKHLNVNFYIHSKQVSSPEINHDMTNQLSVSRQAHENDRPLRIRKLRKVAPAANDMDKKTVLNESTVATRFMDFRKNLGNDSSKPRNSTCRVTGKFHNRVPHNNKYVKAKGRSYFQERNSKGLFSKMNEASPSSRHQQNRCSNKIAHEEDKHPAAPDSSTRHPYRHTSVKRVQFGNNNNDHGSVKNKRRAGQYGGCSRRREVELTSSLRKERKDCPNVEKLKLKQHYIVGEPTPNPLLTQRSSSAELQDNALERENVLDRHLSAEKKDRRQIQTRNDIPKDWKYTNKAIGYDSSNKIIREEELMSPIDELDFVNLTRDTTSHTNSHQNFVPASAFKRPNVPHGALQDMVLNNSTKNVHFMSKSFDLNSDFITEESSVFPNTTDDISASAIFDHNSPIVDNMLKHRTCFQRNDGINACRQNRTENTHTQSKNQ